MRNRVLKIGTRGSELALWQARWIQQQLMRVHPRLETSIHVIKTTGDKVLNSLPSAMGDKGIFTKEIEQALCDEEIDIAVHSLKDLPTEVPGGLMIGAITEREDPRDVFIPHPANPKRDLESQPTSAKIATGSMRRRCQLLNRRPDLEIIDLRGNVNTRFRKLETSDWQGMVLAKAGVGRLGMLDRVGEVFEIEAMLPAVGQGALAVEIRTDDSWSSEIVRGVHHRPTEQATRAERALLRRLECGCQVPLGAFGRIMVNGVGKKELAIDGMVGSLDGKSIIRASISGNPEGPEGLGEQLGEMLLDRGASEILRDIRQATPLSTSSQ